MMDKFKSLSGNKQEFTAVSIVFDGEENKPNFDVLCDLLAISAIAHYGLLLNPDGWKHKVEDCHENSIGLPCLYTGGKDPHNHLVSTTMAEIAI